MIEVHPEFDETLLADGADFEGREGESNVDICLEAHFRIMIVLGNII